MNRGETVRERSMSAARLVLGLLMVLAATLLPGTGATTRAQDEEDGPSPPPISPANLPSPCFDQLGPASDFNVFVVRSVSPKPAA